MSDNIAPMMDWTQHIDLGEVKDVFHRTSQEFCKSDWAYSCIEAFNGALNIANKKEGLG